MRVLRMLNNGRSEEFIINKLQTSSLEPSDDQPAQAKPNKTAELESKWGLQADNVTLQAAQGAQDACATHAEQWQERGVHRSTSCRPSLETSPPRTHPTTPVHALLKSCGRGLSVHMQEDPGLLPCGSLLEGKQVMCTSSTPPPIPPLHSDCTLSHEHLFFFVAITTGHEGRAHYLTIPSTPTHHHYT